MPFFFQCRFYGKANPLKKINPSQKLAAPQKQRLLSRKKLVSMDKLETTRKKNVADVAEYLWKKSLPIELQPDAHVGNRFNVMRLARQKGLTVVDIAKSWTMYKRKNLNARTAIEHEIALSRDKAILALGDISKKLAAISLVHDYNAPPSNRRIATFTRPVKFPFIC